MRRNLSLVARRGRRSPRSEKPQASELDTLLQKAQQNEQILQRYQHFELQLLDTVGFSAMLDLLLRQAPQFFQLEDVSLYLYDPQQTLMELLQGQLPDGLQLLLSKDALDDLYGQPPQVRLVKQESQPLSLFASQRVRSVAMLPLMRHGLLVGSLHFGSDQILRFSSDKSTDFITHLASVVAVCLENAVNQERLRRLSMIDMLTQVKNRRAFQQALDSEVARAARSGTAISLIFIDLDHFKRVNDNYGHQAGDRVLKAVAQHIAGLLRKSDHVCRYGGEEFALVLPECGKVRALEVAERIRQQIADLALSGDNGEPIRQTLSLGVSCWQPILPVARPDEPLPKRVGELLSRADSAVYQSKEAGRNCVHYIDCQMDAAV